MATRSQRPAAPEAPPGGSRENRHRARATVRHELVLDAARSAFFELGMDKTSMREIARRAGYTPGALYSYFPSKEHIYGTLLGESLQRLNAQVTQALAATANEHDQRLCAAAGAFFDFYRNNPRDMDLGFYLFQGIAPRGLTREIDKSLNDLVRQALQPCVSALQGFGFSHEQATREITALFAHIVGLLVLRHTGRIRMFGQSAQALFEAYVTQLTARARGAVQTG